MSGFGTGGGFGSQPQQPFGSSSFNAPPGFGGGFAPPANTSPPASNNAFGAAGFSQAPGFGQPAFQQQPPPSGSMAFGISPNVVPSFDSSQPFPTSSGFGQSANLSGFSGQSTGGFTNPSSSNFHSSATSSHQQGFSNTTTGASPFGAAPPPSSFQTPSSGNYTGNPFGGSSMAPQNPFGAISGGTAMSFGASSSLLPTAAGPRFGKKKDNNKKNARSSLSSSGVSPFGITGRMMESEERMDDDLPPATNLPFGTPVAVGSSKTRVTSAMDDDVETSKQDLLAKLKAKKDKLMRLAEKKNIKTKMMNNGGATLNANAPIFEPHVPEENSSLAEKNAIRFAGATNQATRSLMPSELAGAAVDYASLRVEGRGDRENLKNAVSLVGTCTFMCPDEELLRRERESDIQLLEIPLPGKLHPSDWTLRNTVVKRFRRSAADYKLDVPEWVRPPEVLESVCGYLEEWVMERDRQGPDPRFPNSGTPPPLDVYQFIWDRTRMVRKDFTLQNYVGTGGNCDARAVRCHERICRWHTMCEHQLSHIQEFVSMQSQQNIQELGQTMKTLNQLYDDSLGRSIIEVPDKSGSESGKGLSTYKYGCTKDTVQGTGPVDYDGVSLKNEPDERSLMATATVHGPSRGTAEPEMRGLYILLTIDNDGGMEVLKYAARLFRDRPELYHSRPVQLALSIYKAKKENNYARFFKILKSSSTPYLFACLMFKHVEHMRKKAFEICNKSYGGRTKEGEPLYDSYPLKRWEMVLCYEDIDEARNACKHYNITVLKQPYKSSSGTVREEEFISWKSSSFKEPRDPDKGVIISLRPKKMIKTIERKLNGATRLAVCRGAASGEGSVLSEKLRSPRIDIVQSAPTRETERHFPIKKEEISEINEKEKVGILLQQQQEEDAIRKSREEERMRAEREFAEQQAAKLRKEQEEAAIKRQVEEDLKRKAEKEERIKRDREQEEARKREEQLKLEAIKEKERLERIEQQRKKEAEERRLQEEEQRRLAQIEAEKRRAEAERKRREEEQRRLQELEERRRLRERQLDEQRAVATHAEWREKANKVRKEIFFKRLMNKIPRRVFIGEKTGHSLKLLSVNPSENQETLWIENACMSTPPEKGTRLTVESLIASQSSIDVYNILEKAVDDCFKLSDMRRIEGIGEKVCFILKIAVHVISSDDLPMRDLVRKWVDSNFHFGKVYSSSRRTIDVRLVLVDATKKHNAESSDAAIFFIPQPVSSDKSIFDIATLIDRSSNILHDYVPRIALVMAEEDCVDTPGTFVVESKNFPPVYLEKVSSTNPETLLKGLGGSLATAFEEISLESAMVVSRISIHRLCYLCVNEIVWHDISFEARDDLLTYAITVLDHLVEEIVSYSQEMNRDWPPVEFLSGDDVVPDYFDEGLHLPANWHESLRRCVIEPKVKKVQQLFRCKLSVVLQKLLEFAPADVVDDCMSMLEQRLIRRCFQSALRWAMEADDSIRPNDAECVYIPHGSLHEIIKRAVSRCQENTEKESESSRRVLRLLDESTWRSMSLTPRSRKAKNGITSSAEPTLIDAHAGVESNATGETSISVNTVTQPSSEKKRGRDRLNDTVAVTESKAFTKKLRAMVQGGLARDIVIGHTTLSSLLREDTNVMSPK